MLEAALLLVRAKTVSRSIYYIMIEIYHLNVSKKRENIKTGRKEKTRNTIKEKERKRKTEFKNLLKMFTELKIPLTESEQGELLNAAEKLYSPEELMMVL